MQCYLVHACIPMCIYVLIAPDAVLIVLNRAIIKKNFLNNRAIKTFICLKICAIKGLLRHMHKELLSAINSFFPQMHPNGLHGQQTNKTPHRYPFMPSTFDHWTATVYEKSA